MSAKLEIESSEQAKALYARLDKDERALVRDVLRHVDQASLMPEQSLLIQLNILEQLLENVQQGRSVGAVIGDADTFAQRAIAEIGEEVRQQRHIGALMAGIAICAIVLLVISAYDIIRGLIAGTALMNVTSSLNLGHIVCFIAVLAGTRFFVMGDKKAEYNDPQKARRRTQLVGFLFIVGFIALLVGVFASVPVVLTAPSLYMFIIALVLLLLWKLSGRL